MECTRCRTALIVKELTLSTLLASESERKRITALFSDIAEIEARKQTETRLRKSEQKFKDFIMSENEGFILFDADLNLSEINDKALEIFPTGSTREGLKGMHILSISPALKETGRYHNLLSPSRRAVK